MIADQFLRPRTPLRLLLAQYDASHEYLRERLANLSDEEYRWEPTPGCWSVRRRGEAVTAQPQGKGDWVLDFERPEPASAPMTTLAWRLCHLVAGQMMRYDYTFGGKSLTWDEIELPGTVADAFPFLDRSHQAWRAGLAGLSESDLETIGLSTMPWGLDPHLPFADIVWWTNRELIHHAAEIGLLRDLWNARASSLTP